MLSFENALRRKKREKDMNLADFEANMASAVAITELDQRLEMGVWIFQTHDGTTACCGAGCSDCNRDSTNVGG